MNALKVIATLAISTQAAQLSAEATEFVDSNVVDFYNTDTLNAMEDELHEWFKATVVTDDSHAENISGAMTTLKEKLEAAVVAREDAWNTFEATATTLFDDLTHDLQYTELKWMGSSPVNWQKN